ncbi:hypothetical protein ACOMHN_028755 [Nucella lapillus]
MLDVICSIAQRYHPDIPIEAYSKKKTIAFRRINSLPPPALRLDCDSPTEFLEAQCHSAPTAASPSDPAACGSGTGTKVNILEEGSSQDSGVSLDKDLGFKIPPAPASFIRRKSKLNDICEETCSPHKYSPVKSPQKRSLSFSLGNMGTSSMDDDSPVRLKRSTLTCGQGTDDDDGFLDLADEEVSEISEYIPEGLCSLMNDPVIEEPSPIVEEPSPCIGGDSSTPVTRRILPAKRFLRRSQSVSVDSRPKRLEPPEELANQSKRWKSEISHDDSCHSEKTPARRLHRSHSETAEMIMSAVHRMSEEPDLIADSSKPHVLPMVRGKHQDLKSISLETLSMLLSGDYADQVEEFHIIDCRYPYEFNGGHIQQARNIYTRDSLIEEYLQNPRRPQDPSKRFLLVFHCEFSSERGPSLYRFLRSRDRESNKECYPFLHYPEIYLLEGGYKAFFEQHKDLCEPQAYRQMLDKDFSDDLRKFRTKSKSWAGDKCQRPGLRNLKF